MRKLLILIFGSLVALPAISQTQLAEVIKLWKTKKVPVADGYTYRYQLWDKYDTALYFQTGIDTFDVVVTFKKVSKTKPPLPDIVTTVDDNVAVGAGQAYNPVVNAGDNIFITNGWSHMKDQKWNQNPDGTPIHYNKTFSFVDNVVGAYVELECICHTVEWWTEKRVNHGIVSIQIDGGNAVDLDLYDPRTDNSSTLVWTSPKMMNATHKIRINYTGRKNTAASQTNVGHDKFVIYKTQ
jgi:hypothetical protein